MKWDKLEFMPDNIAIIRSARIDIKKGRGGTDQPIYRGKEPIKITATYTKTGEIAKHINELRTLRGNVADIACGKTVYPKMMLAECTINCDSIAEKPTVATVELKFMKAETQENKRKGESGDGKPSGETYSILGISGPDIVAKMAKARELL